MVFKAKISSQTIYGRTITGITYFVQLRRAIKLYGLGYGSTVYATSFWGHSIGKNPFSHMLYLDSRSALPAIKEFYKNGKVTFMDLTGQFIVIEKI